jgi:hypothetical protein
MHQRLAQYSSEDRRIIEVHQYYVILDAFWVGFDSYEVGAFECPYTKVVDEQAWHKGMSAAMHIQLRRGNCPGCS